MALPCYRIVTIYSEFVDFLGAESAASHNPLELRGGCGYGIIGIR